MAHTSEFTTLRARKAAVSRLLALTPDERQAMTEKARAARYERYIERLKAIVDPDGTLYSDEERTRRAHWLAEQRATEARLTEQRRAAERERQAEMIAAAGIAFEDELAS